MSQTPGWVLHLPETSIVLLATLICSWMAARAISTCCQKWVHGARWLMCREVFYGTGGKRTGTDVAWPSAFSQKTHSNQLPPHAVLRFALSNHFSGEFGDAASAGGEKADEQWLSWGGWGGEERVAWSALPGGDSQGMEPLCWCPSPGPVGKWPCQGSVCQRWESNRLPNSPLQHESLN